MNSLHKWPVKRKMFPFDDVIMPWVQRLVPILPYLSCYMLYHVILQVFFNEIWELSYCQLCHHWWHCRLSWRQPAVPPVMTNLSSWQLSVISVIMKPNCTDIPLTADVSVKALMYWRQKYASSATVSRPVISGRLEGIIEFINKEFIYMKIYVKTWIFEVP